MLPNSWLISEKPSPAAPFLEAMTMSYPLRIASLLSLKNSLRSLLSLFRLTAHPVFLLTATPSLLRSHPFSFRKTTKCAVLCRRPDRFKLTKPALFNNLSHFGNEKDPIGLRGFGRVLRRGLYSDSFATLRPSALQDLDAALGLHPGPEAVGPGPLNPAWLVRPLHDGVAFLKNRVGINKN